MAHRLSAAVAAVIALSGPFGRSEPAPLRDPGQTWTLLSAASAEAPVDARACYLGSHMIRWTVPEGTTRVRLLASETGRIRARPGSRASGESLSALLEFSPPPNLPDAARYSHVKGQSWLIPEGAALQIDRYLRGQEVVVAEDSSGLVLDATGVQSAGALDARFGAAAAASPLGARPGAAGTEFRLWAPTAQAVAVCLYDTPTSPARRTVALQEDPQSGVWSVSVPADIAPRFYLYLVDVFVPGMGIVRNRVTDPYSLSLCGDSERSAVADLGSAESQPAGWAADRSPQTVRSATDMVVYEMHVRDFSRDDATVPPADRGRYLGFAHPDSDGMRHLKALAEAGLTDVHLMPVFDFASVPERHPVSPLLPQGTAPDGTEVQAAVMKVCEHDAFNWGYDPVHYMAPEGSYSSDPDAPLARVRELRALVVALHGAGLRVGLDVVYNHTMADGQDPWSVLDRIVPGYYHRLDAQGRVESSACNSNTATEATMMARLASDACVVWARDYHVDSFRFDLMGHMPRRTLERIQAAVDAASGRHINLIGEGWNFGEVQDGARFVQASQLSLQGSGIGTFNDRMRDAVRGGHAGDAGPALLEQGWLNGLSYAPNGAGAPPDAADRLGADADLIRAGLAGSIHDYVMQGRDGKPRRLRDFDYGGQPAGYAAEPSEVVNYIENHDNQTLFDNNALRLPLDTPPAERARVQALGSALVLLSQGIAYLHAGQDILRSKSLDRNSFNSGDAFNPLDWSLASNHFGVGLPPAPDNARSWPQMKPVLARAASLAPGPADIRSCFEETLALMRVRRSSTLFRMASAADIRERLRFLNTGTDATPSVIAGVIDGHGYPGAAYERVLFVVSADTRTRSLGAGAEAGRPWRLHPALSGDARAAQCSFDAGAGTLSVPARTAAVFVLGN